MTTIDTNSQLWGKDYDWGQGGEEWSGAWGGSSMQWRWSLLPRIDAFIPASTILEIAPGFGRWTEYLQHYCDRLIGVDLNANCISACKTRFGHLKKLEFFQNDGRLLKMVADNEVDFAFSFDSLVHADIETLDSYLAEFSRILSPDGVAVIHHSNLAPYSAEYLKNAELDDHGRDHTTSAALFKKSAAAHGLHCFAQELFPWGVAGNRLTDCVSYIARAESPWASLHGYVENVGYMQQAHLIAQLSGMYGQFKLPAEKKPA